MGTKGITVDDKFLKSFLDRGGQAATPTGQQVDANNVDAFLKAENEAATAAQENTATEEKVTAALADNRASKLHERAERQQARTASEQEKAEKAREEAARRDQERQLQATQKGVGLASQVVDQALAPARTVADRVASLPTPGGLGLPLLVLGILLFAVVQVNAQGDTRMKQLWYMLLGRATLQGREILTGTTESAATVGQDVQNLESAVGQLVGDVGADVGNALGNIPIYGGIFSGIGSVLSEFRNLP